MNKDRIIELTTQLEEVTKLVTVAGTKPENLPDTKALFQELGSEIPHDRFLHCELGKAEKHMGSLTGWSTRYTRYRSARECRISLRQLRRRAIGEDYGHGADLAE